MSVMTLIPNVRGGAATHVHRKPKNIQPITFVLEMYSADKPSLT